MQIRILDEAEDDLVEGAQFYDRQRAGLGGYFTDSVLADIESLLLYAGIHSRYFGYHRLLTRRFPFAVYYLVEGDAVNIYAILDCRRHPAFARHRLA